MRKLPIQQGDIIKFNCFYAFNNRIPKCIKQKPVEQKKKIDMSIIILGNFNAS